MLYVITTDRFGEILLEAKGIKAARARAKLMFPDDAPRVARLILSTPCDRCESRPCCCRRAA